MMAWRNRRCLASVVFILAVVFILLLLVKTPREEHVNTMQDSMSSTVVPTRQRVVRRPYDNKTIFKNLCSKSIYRTDVTANYSKIKETIFKYLPEKFDKSTRNFCWSSKLYLQDTPVLHKLMQSYNRNELSPSDVTNRISRITNPTNPTNVTCLPSVFMAGFPKSGSTYLYEVLTKHPSVIPSREKEPHFWTKFPFQDDLYDSLGFLTYLGNFRSNKRNVLSIDASQSVLWDTEKCDDVCAIPRLLKDILPNAKFIIVMRDPADRTYSDYWHLTLNCEGVVKHKSKEIVAKRAFYMHLQREIERINKCFNKHSVSECLHYIHVTATPVLKGCSPMRLGISVYVIYIQRWLQYFSRDQFLFLRHEDLVSDSYTVLKQVWKFLDLEILPRDEFEKTLPDETKERSSYPSMSQKSRDLLNDFFNPFNKQLSFLLNDTKYLWQ